MIDNRLSKNLDVDEQEQMLDKVRDRLIEDQQLSVKFLEQHILDNHSQKINTPVSELKISFDDFLSLTADN